MLVLFVVFMICCSVVRSSFRHSYVHRYLVAGRCVNRSLLLLAAFDGVMLVLFTDCTLLLFVIKHIAAVLVLSVSGSREFWLVVRNDGSYTASFSFCLVCIYMLSQYCCFYWLFVWQVENKLERVQPQLIIEQPYVFQPAIRAHFFIFLAPSNTPYSYLLSRLPYKHRYFM